jgi:4-hydroxybenzoate polyprenyltransferase
MNQNLSIENVNTESHGLGRWWIYQRERFPLFLNGLAILIFSLAAVGYGWVVSGQQGTPGLAVILVSFSGSFIFFALMRIVDEFKDHEDDSHYRPYRAVPRGLVKLSELRALGIFLALAQFVLALAWSLQLFLLLVCIWIYFLLMSREFFAPRWLKAHPVIYLLSHMVIMPLIALFASAPAWLGHSVTAQELLLFLVLTFCVGMVGEIGRKIRAPEDEEFGVETYTALWGRVTAVNLWLLGTLATALIAGWSCRVLASDGFFAPVLAVLFATTAVVGWRFIRMPSRVRARVIEAVSGLWTLISFGALSASAFFPAYAWG